MIVTTIGTKVSGRSAWLDRPAALSYARMLEDGCPPGCITDAGRTYSEQAALYAQYLRGELVAYAAFPGTSKHETGLALDLREPARSWVRIHGGKYGWMRDRVRNEPWHLEYEFVHDTQATRAPKPIPIEEDPMPTVAEIVAAFPNPWAYTFGRDTRRITAGQALLDARRDAASALALVREVAARPAGAAAIDPADIERIITEAASRVQIEVTVTAPAEPAEPTD